MRRRPVKHAAIRRAVAELRRLRGERPKSLVRGVQVTYVAIKGQKTHVLLLTYLPQMLMREQGQPLKRDDALTLHATIAIPNEEMLRLLV